MLVFWWCCLWYIGFGSVAITIVVRIVVHRLCCRQDLAKETFSHISGNESSHELLESSSVRKSYRTCCSETVARLEPNQTCQSTVKSNMKANSPVWTRQWSFIWWRSLKAFPQNSHLKGRSPVCTGRWVIRDETSGKLLPQNLHSTTPPDMLPAMSFEPLVPGLLNGFSSSIGEFSCGSIDESIDACRLAKWDGGGRSCGRYPESCACPSRCDTSRYLSVSSECDKMCRVSLLWWGKVCPQYMQGYIGPLLLLTLFCSLEDEDDSGNFTRTPLLLALSPPCTSVDDSCNQTKRKTINFFVKFHLCLSWS